MGEKDKNKKIIYIYKYIYIFFLNLKKLDFTDFSQISSIIARKKKILFYSDGSRVKIINA